MAQFYENFSSATVGSPHPDFTLEFGDAAQSVVSGNPLAGSDASLQMTWVSGTFLRSAFSWVVGQTSGETTIKFLATFDNHTTTDNGQIIGPILSGSGDDVTRTGYAVWYGENYRLSKYDSDSGTTVDSTTGLITVGAATRYIELYRNGSTIEARSWAYSGGTRPATADLSFADGTPLPVAGFFGISALLTGSGSITQQFQVHEIEAATDGSTLPGGPVSATEPSIANINTTNQVVPGTTATITGTNLTNTTGVTVGGVAQTAVAVVNDTTVTFTVVRGGNPYNQDLTATLTSADGTANITVQQTPEAGTFAVTAQSPNTVDTESFWTGLVDTATGDPITIVNGDQGWIKNPNNLTNLAISPVGEITADQTGTFVAQIRLESEGVWGGDQTVSYTTATAGPAVSTVNVPTAGSYGIGDTLSFTVNWDVAATVTGTPRLPITLSTGRKYANYVSGSGTTALVFSYTIQEGDNDADGISLNAIELNGGTIKDGSTNNASLTLSGVESTAGVLVDGVRPVITIAGDNPYNMTVGETYVEQGATASDNQDGPLGSVTGTGSVDGQTEGQYTITYPGAGVVDAAGNVALDVTRVVNVNAVDAWPFSKRISYAAPKTWTWGNRHPKTGMRVRIYK